jgi:Zn-dependent peptidase ImmA (M78 family)/transcriptional regulator with XRE-family HTH domain
VSGVASARMITLVRESRAWSQKKLATESGLSQGYLSKVESGQMDLSGERLAAVADALDSPVELLIDDARVRGLEITCLHHRRRRSKMTVAAAKKVEAVANLTRISVEGLMADAGIAPVDRLARIDLKECGGPPEVARALRTEWGLSDGPIPDMLQVLEDRGVLVVVRPMGSNSQDAVSTWPADADHSPIMIVNSGLSPDRERFTVAHELGHLVMHRFPEENQEHEADHFAAEFLVPSEQIRPSLEGLRSGDFRRLMELKATWKVSIAMLIKRALDIGCISERQYKEFMIRLNQMGWRTNEPVDLPREHATLVGELIRVHVQDQGYDLQRLAAAALMRPRAFQRNYLFESQSPEVSALRFGGQQ